MNKVIRFLVMIIFIPALLAGQISSLKISASMQTREQPDGNADGQENGIANGQTEVSDATTDFSELQQQLPIGSRGRYLTGNDLEAYISLKEQIGQVAAGERADTSFSVPISLFGVEAGKEYEEELLGLSGKVFTLNESNNKYEYDKEVLGEAYRKLKDWIAVDFERVFNALTADCPYELYWYNYQASWSGCGVKVRGELSEDGARAYFSFEEDSVTFDFKASEDYVSTEEINEEHPGCVVDLNKTRAAAQAAERAEEIVQEASSLSDAEKLAYYKEFVCERTVYNEEAAAAEDAKAFGSTAPWQLIGVFLSTETEKGTVVCEGYAKAFQYLCDLTDFEDDTLYCVTVSGLMINSEGEGAHTWNLIETGTGGTFLVDVTNCDEGTIGAPDNLFMEDLCEGDPVQGYLLTMPSGEAVLYQYDERTRSLYTEEELTIGNQS